MKPRHAAVLALVGWCLSFPASSLAGSYSTKYSNYTNVEYGFSFQYPSGWMVKEGDGFQLDWGYLGLVETALPHGKTVVIVSFCEPCDTSEKEKVVQATQSMRVRVDPKLYLCAMQWLLFCRVRRPVQVLGAPP